MALIRAALVAIAVLAFFLIARIVRAAGVPGSPLAHRLAPLFCRTMLRLLRVRVTVIGSTETHGGARLVVANHVSWIDPLVLGSRESLSALAKREVGGWPVIATFARLQDTILFDRRRRRGLPAANRAMAARLSAGRSVLLFPEGTTHDGRSRGRFLTSHLGSLRDWLALEPALACGRVQPAAIAYADPAAAWVGDATLVGHVWTMLRRPPMTATLHYGEPRLVERGHDRKALGRLLAADVERLVAAADPSPHGVAATGTPGGGFPRPTSSTAPSMTTEIGGILDRSLLDTTKPMSRTDATDDAARGLRS